MLYATMQPSLLGMLHAQHRYYTSELGTTHKQLGREYEKLARVELELLQRHERSLTRQEKKKLQWTRSLTKRFLKSLELQQAWLHSSLQQCHNLIAFCESRMYSAPAMPWSALAWNDPFSSASSSTTFRPQHQQPPQYWDLLMLRERRESSPFAPSWSAESGYHEGNASGLPCTQGVNLWFSTNTESGMSVTAANVTLPTKTSSIWGKDDVPDLREPASHAQVGASATSPHKRRYSENAIQPIESRLSLPKQTHHKRGNSASATPVPHRTPSVQTVIA